MLSLDTAWIMRKRWRVGRKLGRTIYAQVEAEADDRDVLLGMMDTAEVAAAIVEQHNAGLEEPEG